MLSFAWPYQSFRVMRRCGSCDDLAHLESAPLLEWPEHLLGRHGHLHGAATESGSLASAHRDIAIAREETHPLNAEAVAAKERTSVAQPFILEPNLPDSGVDW
jgi:hypothetical protein